MSCVKKFIQIIILLERNVTVVDKWICLAGYYRRRINDYVFEPSPLETINFSFDSLSDTLIFFKVFFFTLYAKVSNMNFEFY